MSDVVAFLRARVGEDEAAAGAVASSNDWGNRPWEVTECSEISACPCIVYQGQYKQPHEAQVPLIQYIADAEDPEYAVHIARHDPARVLREVEAKRAILAEYAPVAKNDGPSEPEYAYGWAEGLGMAVRILAAVYRDHPDYDPDWAR